MWPSAAGGGGRAPALPEVPVAAVATGAAAVLPPGHAPAVATGLDQLATYEANKREFEEAGVSPGQLRQFDGKFLRSVSGRGLP